MYPSPIKYPTELQGDAIREGYSGNPMYPSPIKYPTELRQGDHILFQTTEPPFRPIYQSALVVGGEKECVDIISYSRAGIYEDSVQFNTLRHLHRVEYTRCRYSTKESVSRARWRVQSGEDHYHALYNNSHFLATWAKTGNECLLYDVISSLNCEEGEWLLYKFVESLKWKSRVHADGKFCDLINRI